MLQGFTNTEARNENICLELETFYLLSLIKILTRIELFLNKINLRNPYEIEIYSREQGDPIFIESRYICYIIRATTWVIINDPGSL